MNTIFKILLISITILTACQNEDKKLFWISENKGHINDFIFIAESTNKPYISYDSLLYFLTNEEILSAKKLMFKNFGKIYSNNEFDVYILLKEGSDSGRDYTYIIRTFTKNYRIIDSYDLAYWIDSKNLYCVGSIDQNLIIKRICKQNEEVKIINKEGKITFFSLKH